MRAHAPQTQTRSIFEKTINHANAIDRNLPYGPRPRPIAARMPSRADMPQFGPDVSKKLISVGLVMLMVVSAIAIVSLSVPEPGSAYEVRANPIEITSDSGFTADNGVTGGSGTEVDPYIIQGWEISTKTDACIEISGTRAHFVIRDVHLYGKPSFTTCVGVYLYDVWNGRIEGSLINDTVTAVHIAGGYRCTVTGNTIVTVNDYAVLIVSSQEMNVVNNYIDAGAGGDGVRGESLVDGMIMDNTITAGDAVYLYSSWIVNISHNDFLSCGRAIYASSSAFLSIESNRMDGGTGDAIYFAGCDTVLIKGNEILENAGAGIYVASNSPNMEISYNRVNESRYYGLWLKSSSATVVYNNSFENNSATTYPVNGTGIVCAGTTGALIYHNNFWNNTPQQAWDDSFGANFWYNPALGEGNFWDNYTGEDGPPADGIGDTPFELYPNDNMDSFPLMEAVRFNRIPVAVVSADPLIGGIGQPISLDGSSSHDPDEGCGDKIEEYRWDFDGDGLWDTGWLAEDSTTHSYPRSGNFTAYLQVRDSQGLLGLDSVVITITTDVIPEFASLLIPLTITMALFAVISRTRRSDREQKKA